MKNRLLVLVFALAGLFTHKLSAQNDFVKIIGPDYLCSAFCDSAKLTVVVDNTIFPAPYTVHWTGPAGFSSSQLSINLCDGTGSPLFPPGAYTYTVVVTSANGVTASTTHSVFFAPYLPLQIISSNRAPCNSDSTQQQFCEKVCPNTTVTYSLNTISQPGGTNSALTWQVNGASHYEVNQPFGNSVTVTWGPAGSGSVSVVSTTAGNPSSGYCAGEDAICVTIIDQPVAKFTTNPAPTAGNLQICKGQTVYFINQSTGADIYEWSFSDDLSKSAIKDPNHTYNTAGNYTVTLVAASSCLCADTTQLNIEVLDAVSPSLNCVGTICPGETVTYTASNGCAPFTWTVSPNGSVLSGGLPGTDSITIQWNDGPVGLISLLAQPCSGAVCPRASVIEVPVITDNAEIAGKERVCPSSTEVYTIEAFGGVNFMWTLSGGGTIKAGQGTNKVIVDWTASPNNATTYWLSVVYDNCYLGCGGRDSIGVKILSPFVVNGQVEACENSMGTFSSKLTFSGLNLSCNWALHDPMDNVIWTSPAATASVNATFNGGAGFYRLIAVPANINLTCGDEAEWAVNVPAIPAKPTMLTGAPLICPGGTYTYEVTGAGATGSLKWTVQNGPGAPTNATGNPLNITWAATGPRSLTVAQVSADGLGCLSDTTRLLVSAIGVPAISGDGLVCNGATEAYTLGALQNVNVQWTIVPATAGVITDGQGSGTIHVYWKQAGGHAISVSVCSQNNIFPVTVLANPTPTVNFPSSICAGALTTVSTSTAYAAYSWRDVNGSELSTLASPSLGSGNYYLQVSDANGCTGNTDFSVGANQNPNISLSTSDATGFCNNSQFVLLSSLGNTDGDYTYSWLLNGTPLGITTPTYATNQYGTYTVQVTSQYGCTAISNPILLFNYCGGGGPGSGFPGGGAPPCPPGSVSITIDPSMRCDSFQFHAIGGPLYAGGAANWKFGLSGGALLGTSNSDDPFFVFPNAGKYLAILQVQLTDGSICEIYDSISVAAKAQFNSLPECAGSASTFKEVSTFLPSGSINSWQWNFGDGNTSNNSNPSNSYTTGGPYTVSLTVTANNGCTSIASAVISVPSGTVPAFTIPTANCSGNALEFSNSDPSITDLQWNFGDPASGSLNTASGSPTFHNYNVTGPYTVSATATNVFGCTATNTQMLTISPNGLSGAITPAAPLPMCEGKTVTLTAPGTGVSWLWSDGSSTKTLIVTKEGNYSVTLTDANGCTFAPPPVKVEVTPSPDALIKSVLTNELGQIIGTTYPTLTTCAGEDVWLQAIANGSSFSYVWSGGGNDDDNIFSDDRNNLLSVGTHTYTVTVTDLATGCSVVTSPFVVTVNPVPSNVSISTSGACAGAGTTLSYNGTLPANWQLIWNTGETTPTITADEGGAYSVRVINEYGCAASSTPIAVLPGPLVSAIPAGCHTRCTPDTLCLPTIPNISSWQWYFNGAAVPGGTTPNFVAQQSGSYYAVLTDVYGCSSQSDPLTLDLYVGYGDILGKVWSDVNSNGVIDAGDTLISGIKVNLNQNATLVGNGQSGASGAFAFSNILSTNYEVQVDPTQTLTNWQIIIGQAPVTLSGCGDQENCGLLLRFVCPTLSSTLNLSACSGGSAMYNGTSIAAGSSQQFTLTGSFGCDSVVTVVVQALPPVSSAFTTNVCPGDFYTYNGTQLAVGASQAFTLTASNGCDSVVTVTVGALPTAASILNVQVCPGDFYTYNGTQLPVGASQAFTLTASNGCDSVVTVTVGALPTATSNLNVKACPGGTYTYNGVVMAVGTSQAFTLTGSNSCDSTVIVTVSALATASSDLNVSVCPGESYEYNGVSLAMGATQAFNLTGSNGCDSVVTVTVGALPAKASTLNVNICPGETYTYNGIALAAGTVQDFALSASNGCDSIVTVQVQALLTPTIFVDVQLCPGTTYLYNGIEIAAGVDSTFIYQGSNGCDSTIIISTAVYPVASFDLETEFSCFNAPTGAITVSNPSGGVAPYRYSLDGVNYQDALRFEDLSARAYTVYLEDSNGCIFEQDTVITAIQPIDVVLPDAFLACDSSQVTVSALISGSPLGLSYKWWNGTSTPTTLATEPGAIWLEVSNVCETQRRVADVKLSAVPSRDYVYVPNVIKQDPKNYENALFRPYFAPDIEILSYEFEVFDRWGNKMFHSNDSLESWEGAFRKNDMNPGVYVWYIDAQVQICGHKVNLLKKGDVTVLR